VNGPRIVADDAIPHLAEAFGEVTRVRGSDIARDHVRHADALLVRSVTRVDAALLSGTPVRFVGSATAGIDHVDTAALQALGVTVANAPGCNARAVVEYVLAATLGMDSLRGPVGVVGFGQIGRRLTTALRRLGATVWVCDPPRAEAGCTEERYLSLPALLERCNTVTVHVPKVRQGPHATPHLLDAESLRRLPEGARVINTSRGEVVDNTALHAWLDAGRGDAVLDVWEGEPSLRWSLLGHPALVRATPHIAGYTAEGKARGTAMVHTALARAFGLEPSFEAADVLPPVSPLPLELDEVGVLAHVHAMVETDAALREVANLPEPQRARAFEDQRRRYAFRRELSAYPAAAGAQRLWAALRGLS